MKHPSYQERTLRAVSAIFADDMRGTVSHLHVRHDDGCPMLKGRGVCRCVPDIELQTPIGKYMVDTTGVPHHIPPKACPVVEAAARGAMGAESGAEK